MKYYEMNAVWPEVTQFSEAKGKFFEWLAKVTGESQDAIFWLEYEAEHSILEWRWYLKNDAGIFYLDPDNRDQPAQDRTRQEVEVPPKEVLDKWEEILVLIKGAGHLQKSG